MSDHAYLYRLEITGRETHNGHVVVEFSGIDDQTIAAWIPLDHWRDIGSPGILNIAASNGHRTEGTNDA